jgi:hypothetical protein
MGVSSISAQSLVQELRRSAEVCSSVSFSILKKGCILDVLFLHGSCLKLAFKY